MDITKESGILGKKFSFSAVDTNKVIQELNLPKNANILDVGTGIGSLAITLALNGYKVVTGEPSDDESIYANQNWSDNAKKVNVDHLIEFTPFDAKKIPYEDGSFDAIFSLGTFHHIKETERKKVLKEFIRTTKHNSIICFFEPNHRAIKMIRESDALHPEAADPNKYIQGFDLSFRKIAGSNFDAFIFHKQ